MARTTTERKSNSAGSDLAFITPSVLTWALDKSALTRSVIADKINVSEEVLRAWEKTPGSHPPFPKAEKLAELLLVPFGIFFLPKAPVTELPLPDRRTLTKGYKPTPEFLQLLNDVLVKQDWYKEHLGSPVGKTRAKLPFVGRFSTNDSVLDVAKDIRAVLNITPELRNSVGSWSEYLSTLSRHAEEVGMLVMRSSVVANATNHPISFKEVQGFAIADTVAPVVFVNSADFKAAQIFTLAHELAHVWVGDSSIDTPDPGRLTGDAVELFCNRVATAVLVPRVEFLSSWDAENPDSRLAVIAKRFWVSTLVVLRRALELGKVTESEFHILRKQELEKIDKKRAGGGDYYRNIVVRMGARLTYTVLGEVNRDKLPLRDAARLLGVRVKTLVTFAEMAK